MNLSAYCRRASIMIASLLLLQAAAQNQKKPGLTPERLLLNFESTVAYSEMSATFHPNGKEFYFTTFDSQGSPKIMVSYLKGSKWSTPIPLIEGDGMVPAITKDGLTLYYSSIELTAEDDNKKEPNIWMMVRKEEGWSNPTPLGSEINSPDFGEWFPSVADDGTLYFKRSDFMEGVENIYYSETKDGEFMQAKFLDAAFNKSFNTEDPYMAPDESYIIFSPGGPNLYGPMHIAFKDQKGNWSAPRDMGLEGTMPSLSVDGKYLIFIKEDNVYWVDARIIKKLR